MGPAALAPQLADDRLGVLGLLDPPGEGWILGVLTPRVPSL